MMKHYEIQIQVHNDSKVTVIVMLEVASDTILQTFGNCEEQLPEKPVGHQSAD